LKLRSKHVVQLYDIITINDDSIVKKALVLEHIEGKDLEIGSIEPGKEILETLWQIACGLVDIHREGIIHRDIKPNNIRVNMDGIVKILDFGLARSEGAEARTRSIIGTPTYMAPELYGNTNISFDKAIDVYAFGVLALSLIMNAPIPRELRLRPPKPLSAGSLAGLFPGLSTAIIEVIEGCFSHDPKDRPSMAAVEAILRRHLVFNRHRALLVLDGKIHEINSVTTNVNIKSGDLGAVGVKYNGLQFIVSNLVGSVLVNNMTINVGDELPECCVIAFGSRARSRSFVTFDVSHPEVIP